MKKLFKICAGVFYLLCFFVIFRFPVGLNTTLESSWLYPLADGFIRKDLFFGKNIVFTFGPLGYFSYPFSPYFEGLFELYFLWWVFFAVVTAYFHYQISEKNIFSFWSIWNASLVSALISIFSFDAFFYYLIFASFSVFLKQNNDQSLLRDIFICFVLALISLTKFSFFVAILIFFFFYLLSFRLYFFKNRIFNFFVFFGFYLLVWFVVEGSFVYLPNYIYLSFSMLTAYPAAMSSLAVPKVIYVFGLILFCSLSVLVCFSFFNKKNYYFFYYLAVFIVVYSSWRASYLRHFGLWFFLFSSVLPFALSGSLAGKSRSYSLACFFHSFISIAFLFHIAQLNGSWAIAYSPSKALLEFKSQLIHNYRVIKDIGAYKKLLKSSFDKTARDVLLPKVSEIVGHSTIDVFSPEQMQLYLNRLNYSPRPIYQGYAAMNSLLLEKNKEYLSISSAPDYVLFRLRTIDSRLPFMEDSLVLSELIKNYHFVAKEGAFILLKKNNQRIETGADELITTGNAEINQWVEISNTKNKTINQSNLFLTLDFSFSFFGKIKEQLKRPSIIHIQLVTESGDEFYYRIIPSMTKSPMLIAPLILEDKDVEDYYVFGDSLKKLSKFRVLCVEGENCNVDKSYVFNVVSNK